MQTQQTADAIERLAAKLSIPAEHLWGVLTKQGRIEAMVMIGWFAFWSAAALAVWITGRVLIADMERETAERNARRDEARKAGTHFYENPPDNGEPSFWIGVLRISLVLLFGLIAATFVADAVRYYANPEYYALKEVLSVLK